MKINPQRNIEFHSITLLHFKLTFDSIEGKKAAVILSQNPIKDTFLEHMDAYIIIEVADTTEKNHPFSFKKEDGQRIKDFLEETESFENLYICCDSGVSRSSAVAAAILRYYGKSDMEIWKNPIVRPNTLVYKTLCSVFKKPVSRLKIRYLCHINDKALSMQMKKSQNGGDEK